MTNDGLQCRGAARARKPLAPRPRTQFLIQLDPPLVRIAGADFHELRRLEPIARRLELVLRNMLARERAR